MALHDPTCPECGGSGYLYSDNGPAPRAFKCMECGGDGLAPDMCAEIERAASNRAYNVNMNRVLNARAWKGEVA